MIFPSNYFDSFYCVLMQVAAVAQTCIYFTGCAYQQLDANLGLSVVVQSVENGASVFIMSSAVMVD